MLDKPLTAEELTSREGCAVELAAGAFETNANAVGNFSNIFTYDLGLDYYAKYAEQVRAVTADQALDGRQEVHRPDR